MWLTPIRALARRRRDALNSNQIVGFRVVYEPVRLTEARRVTRLTSARRDEFASLIGGNHLCQILKRQTQISLIATLSS